MKLRAVSTAFLACIAAAAFSQDPGAKVTFSSVAAPASRVLEELSKAAGVRLVASPSTANEVLVIHVTDAPLTELMQRIAKVTSGEWKEDSGTYTLVGSTLVRGKEARDEQATYAKKLTKALQSRFDALAKNPSFDAKAAAKLTQGDDDSDDPAGVEMAGAVGMSWGMGGGSGAPTDRAITRLIQGIGVNALIGIDKDSRVVFSSNPTRMQRPFGPGAMNALDALVREQNIYAEAYRRSVESQPKPNDAQAKAIQKMMEMFGQGDADIKPVKGQASKALLVVTRQMLFDGLSFELKVFDTNGKQIIHGNTTVMDMDFSQFAPGEKPGEQKEEQPPKDDKAIEFSATTKELMGSMSKFSSAGGLDAKVSAELGAKLRRPDLYDPLSFSHSEGLIQSAAAKREQLVANLPDVMESFFGMFTQGEAKQTVWSFLSGLKQGDAVNVEEAEGWLVVSPKRPVESREHRLDRQALATLIKASEGKELPSLDDIAAYALRNESPMSNSLSMSYIMLFAPGAMQQGFAGMTSWDMLRLYGTLSPAQKQGMGSGNRIPFGNLNAQQTGIVTKILFGADSELQVTTEEKKKDEFEMPNMFRRMFGGGNRGDYRTEPTEIMPNGLPNDGVLALDVRKSYVAKVADAKGGLNPLGAAPIGADELAMLKFFSEDPTMSQLAGGMMPSIDSLRLGNRTIYDFKFLVAQDVMMEQSLNDNEIKKDAPVVKYANLPSDFQKEVTDKIAQFKKFPFFDPSILMGARGKNIPPQLQAGSIGRPRSQSGALVRTGTPRTTLEWL